MEQLVTIMCILDNQKYTLDHTFFVRNAFKYVGTVHTYTYNVS